MQIQPNRYYRMVMRYAAHETKKEKQARCFNLKMVTLDQQERERYERFREQDDIPTHRVTFYDFESYRVVEGKIKEDIEDKLVLDMGKGREYEFLPF